MKLAISRHPQRLCDLISRQSFAKLRNEYKESNANHEPDKPGDWPIPGPRWLPIHPTIEAKRINRLGND
jgi:hypothetical protein